MPSLIKPSDSYSLISNNSGFERKASLIKPTTSSLFKFRGTAAVTGVNVTPGSAPPSVNIMNNLVHKIGPIDEIRETDNHGDESTRKKALKRDLPI